MKIMTIEYTTHAERRMAERDITESDVETVLEKARLIRQTEETTVKEYKGIAVAFAEKPDKLVVVTVFKPEKSMERRVKKIANPQGWWKTENRDTFINQAYFLHSKGLDEEEIVEHLTKLFNAICAEYGE